MSVYTPITRLQLDQFFSTYALGEIICFEGIQDGIDNTNYFVETTQGSFVLTLFETLTADELPHFMRLLSHLVKHNIQCPGPQPDRQASVLRELNNKPAALFKRLSGMATTSPSIEQCQEIGIHLANVHLSTQDYVFPIKNNNDLDWCKMLLNKIGALLSATDRTLINDELLFQTANASVNLPQGVIHADLFRDNVLFVDDQLSGILDFYSACNGALLFDIAITANDWCCENGDINPDKMTALLSAYENLRPLEQLEKQHWQTMLRAAALRYWLSRLEHQLYPRPGDLIQQKDPLIFRHILQQHRQ
ncbi:MAG: homoserine kinase [Methylococcaceae bacterium]